MVYLKRKIPKLMISVEIDDSKAGIINLDGKDLLVEPNLNEFILSILEENDDLQSRLDYYEKYITGAGDA